MKKIIITAISMTFLFGCALGYVYHTLPGENPVITQNAQLQKDFANGMTQLLNCQYFRNMYPKFYKELPKHTSVFFAYVDDPRFKDYYALTDAKQNIIYLTPNYFAVELDHQRESTMAHEMMHIIGMPKHVTKNPTQDERHADAIYTTTHYCFFPLRPWSFLESGTPPMQGVGG